MKLLSILKNRWVTFFLVVSFFLANISTVCAAFESKSVAAKKNISMTNYTVSSSIKSLGPQPEPPDRPEKGSRTLGPQPEPPDRPQKGSRSLGPQPEPPDRGQRK